MATTLSAPKSFTGVATAADKGGIAVELAFDPAAIWGKRTRYHVGGLINGRPVRGTVTMADPRLVLGPAWCRDGRIGPGDRVTVTLSLEGPEVSDFGEDFAAALAADPRAEAAFQDLAQFYRKAWLAWIDGTKRKPEERARRIAETIRLIGAGVKTRPK